MAQLKTLLVRYENNPTLSLWLRIERLCRVLGLPTMARMP